MRGLTLASVQEIGRIHLHFQQAAELGHSDFRCTGHGQARVALRGHGQ